MLRQRAAALRSPVVALAIAVALSACGIKGPLTPAPKPDSAASGNASKAAPQDPAKAPAAKQ